MKAGWSARPAAQIDLVVIHCTELPDLAMAREYGERELYDSGTGNSGHYYIDRDGSVHLFVHPTRVANHTRGYNPRSVGIELVNRGRYPDWLDSRRQAMDEPYTDAQIDSLVSLLAALQAAVAEPGIHRRPRGPRHARLSPPATTPTRSVFRKRDPGPLFPWPRCWRRCGLRRLQP